MADPAGIVALLLGSLLTGACGGFLAGLLGVGGGTLTVPVLSMFHYPIHSAVGTAAALGVIISLPWAIGFAVIGWGNALVPPFSVGYVNLIGFIAIVPSAMLVAPCGAKTAHIISRERLSRAFACFLLITSIKLFAGLHFGG